MIICSQLKKAAKPPYLIKNATYFAGAIILSLDHYEAVGDYYLYICCVEAVYADPLTKALFTYDGYGRIATAD